MRADAATAREALLALLADETEETRDVESSREPLEMEGQNRDRGERPQEQEADGDDTEMALL